MFTEDHLVPLVATHLRYRVGSGHEVFGRTGLAHLLEHLMFQGSANTAPGEYASLMTGAGARFNAATSFEWTSYYATLPSDQLALALRLEADRMATLPEALDPGRLEIQREVVMNERLQRYDNVPYGTALEHLFGLGHPYRHLPIGSPGDIAALTLEHCREFFLTYYTPGNAILSLVGDAEPERVFGLVERYFGPVPARPGPAPPNSSDLCQLGGDERKRLEIREETAGPALFALFRLPPAGGPELESAAAAVDILGLGRSGRIRRRLVQEARLAAKVDLTVKRFFDSPSAALLSIIGMEGSSLEAIESVLFEEFDLLASSDPTDSEMECAVAQAEREFLERTQTLAGLAGEIAGDLLALDDPVRAFEAMEWRSQVDGSGIRSAAALHFQPGPSAVLTYMEGSG
ncbi:M16 family metallopeptidase [Sphaerimonospora sp. CA-214678]|uniref:M16 family metallopeptidase n=1 Tax=Sphaerimonospora sp. CA-214678 TaxID=3240029 RepID=UPI003D8C6A0D